MTEATDLSLTNFLYYFGWGLAFTGLVSFLGIGSVTYGRRFSNIFTPLYGLVFWWTGNQYWSTQSNTFSGLLITLALLMVPLSFYSWMNDDLLTTAPTRVLMELSLLFSSLMVIYHYPGFSFFISLVGLAVWGFSLDLVIVLTQTTAIPNKSGSNLLALQTKRVSEVFGLLMIYSAYQIDDQYPDYAFWLYLFGLTSSWLGLTTESGNSEFRKFIYACLNLALILLWAFQIHRHIFLFWGVVGVNLYQGYSLFYDGLLETDCRSGQTTLQVNYRIIYNLLIILTAYLFERYSVTTPILDLTFWMFFHAGFLLWLNQTVELFKKHTMAPDQISEEKVWLVYLLFSLVYIGVSLYLTRVIFLLCGVVGVISYLFHLARKVFPSSLVFTGSLVLLGVTMMFFSHQIRIYYGI